MKRKKKIFSLRALVFAVLVTASVSSVTLSRYMTTVTGTATASIAQFEVNLTSTETNMDFDGSSYNGLSESKAYGFKIISESDVALTYRVEVDFGTVAPPAQVSLWIDSGTVQKGDGTTTKFTFEGFNYPLGKADIEHTLYIQVEYATADDNVYTISNLTWNEVEITVTAEQATATTE